MNSYYIRTSWMNKSYWIWSLTFVENKQLKSLKQAVENQLHEQQKQNNELMDELMTVRKKQYLRLPRNNDSVSNRVRNAQSSGCCSSWWGKKDNTSHDMDPKTMHLNITNSINSSNSNYSAHKYDGHGTTGTHY